MITRDIQSLKPRIGKVFWLRIPVPVQPDHPGSAITLTTSGP
jgi:hypothetical protein